MLVSFCQEHNICCKGISRGGAWLEDRGEVERISDVLSLPYVDAAYIGDSDPHKYVILKKLSFEVLALGYDQVPSSEARALLQQLGKSSVEVVRLNAFHPEKYKTSIVRGTMKV